MNTTSTEQKPGLFTAIALMTMVSGIVNLLWGFIASATALGSIIGIICLPIIIPAAILPTILGVFEIIYAAKLLSGEPKSVQPSRMLAAFQISTLIFGNIFSMVVGILALIFYNDITVKEYFARLNGTVTSAPVPESPAPVEQPEALPVPEEPIISKPAPEPVEDPAKPKRIRKVAGK